MAVQDLDICLNISTDPSGKKKTGNEDDSILSLMRERKTQVAKSKVVGSSKSKNDSVKEISTSKKRVKQKSLGKIVARKLKENGVASQNQSAVIKQKLKVKPRVDIKTQAQQNVVSKNVSTISANVRKDDTDKSVSSKADEPIISFTKVTKENFGKTLFAKKRKINNTGSKGTLLSKIFSKQAESEKGSFSLLDSLKKNEQDGVPEKKARKESKEVSFSIPETSSIDKNKKKKQLERNENYTKDNKNTHSSHKSAGKISSLFGHNPEIPNIGQRLVKPINEPVFTKMTFTDLNVHPFMISNLEQNMSITKMTMVQQKAIPQVFSGRDVLIKSQTGSGKTLAYALPIVESLHKIRPKLNRNSGLNALIVVPTRELALQTYECFLKLIKPFTWIVPGYLAGGEKRKAEKARLRKGCNILVGTPGRILDHIKRTEVLKLNDVKYFVLDEADRMFDMGYEKDISGIVSALKISAPSENTGYDAMKLFRQNMKKTFTDDDFEQLENSEDLKESQDDSQNDSVPELNNSESENDEIESNVKRGQEYHSSSDNDSDEEDQPYIKSKKPDRRKFNSDSTKEKEKEKESDVRKNNKQSEENNNCSADAPGKQTILLSATLTQAVEKLAGLAMHRPIFVDAAKDNLETVNGNTTELDEDLVVPESMIQSYVVTPPKLRMVTLGAYITGKCQSHGQHKILVFMATQDMVDYHMEILSSALSKPVDEEDDDSDPLVDVEFFKLHGSMTQKQRTEVFKTFRQAKSGVLFCTDVAARGLDLPKVDCVIQYTGPTLVRDYVHRIGRTARTGSSGSATIFLTPPEIEFVRLLESRRIRIKQEDMDDVLDKLLGPLSKHSTAHSAAIALQNEFETMVMEDPELRKKAYKAYTSWARFYSSYPRDLRKIFNKKKVHLGHYAKSFALRETPQQIGGIGKKLHEKDNTRQQHGNRLANEKHDGEPVKKQKHRQGDEPRTGLLKRVRMLNTSEYGSGLEPVKKPKKS